MARPLYPGDYIRSAGYNLEPGTLMIVGSRDFATHGTAFEYIFPPTLFGEVEVEADTLYELSFGPFYLVNGDGGVATNARDGAVANVSFVVDDGISPMDISGQEFVLRKPDPYLTHVPSIRTHYYSNTTKLVKFGVGVSHKGGYTFPGGDMTNPMPAPLSSTAANTDATSTTQVQDSIGTLAFTAKPGRKYMITYRARVGGISGGTNQSLRIRVRDGGASAPTSSSTVVLDAVAFISVGSGPGQYTFRASEIVTGLSAGTHTLGVWYSREAGTGTAGVQPGGSEPRKLFVQDVTETSAITDGIITVLATGGTDSPTQLSVRPVAQRDSIVLVVP